MKNIPTTRVLIGLTALTLAGSAWAQQVSSTVDEDNGATVTSSFDTNQTIYSGTPPNPSVGNFAAVVTTASGYDFTGANAPTTISTITFTMTMIDGGSAIGDDDFNHLSLVLAAPGNFQVVPGALALPPFGLLTSGANTGIVLNGFRDGGIDTWTFQTTVNAATSSAILSQLTAGSGFLGAYIVSDNPIDAYPTGGNEVFIGNDALDATTTLTFNAPITEVPEPSTYFAAGLALLGLVSPRIRRRRKAA